MCWYRNQKNIVSLNTSANSRLCQSYHRIAMTARKRPHRDSTANSRWSSIQWCCEQWSLLYNLINKTYNGPQALRINRSHLTHHSDNKLLFIIIYQSIVWRGGRRRLPAVACFFLRIFQPSSTRARALQIRSCLVSYVFFWVIMMIIRCVIGSAVYEWNGAMFWHDRLLCTGLV